MGNLYPPPPQIKDGKIAYFGFCVASSLLSVLILPKIVVTTPHVMLHSAMYRQDSAQLTQTCTRRCCCWVQVNVALFLPAKSFVFR